ncbi:MAG: hypothetical protein MI717_00555 [Spirochaetales bacterium]|nr:hypothetical protein [Spirochaetales bacterium]
MFFFLLKKSFFDAWDNLGAVIMGNIATLLVGMAALWPAFALMEAGSALGLIPMFAAIPLLFVVVGVVSAVMREIADYRRFAWSDLKEVLRKMWKPSLLLSLCASAFFAASFFGMTYYTSLGGMLGLGAAALLFWITLGVSMVLLWFFPAANRLDGGFKKLLKKSAILMFDNLGLSLFMIFIAVPLQLFLWPITAFGAFGPAGIQLMLSGALRLQLFRYDWMEEHPDASKKDVPWFELLLEERDRVGKRTLRGMIFPWKE